jgi:Uma2 family endonuclease
MNAPTVLPRQQPVDYPDSDGQPMADNTLQFEWIVTIQGGLDALYRNDPNVFVAGDLLWYPVEGDNTIRQAPDILVAFGRPKGHRGSYRQWEEGGVAPQVVFEILSPGNRFGQMLSKFQFYEQYGVEEYYIYDPDRGILEGYFRQDGRLQEIPSMAGWVSPRLGIRFEMVEGVLQLFGPDGRKFATYIELAAQREQEQREKQQAQQRAEQAEQRAEQQAQTLERLRAQLKALGVDPQE